MTFAIGMRCSAADSVFPTRNTKIYGGESLKSSCDSLLRLHRLPDCRLSDACRALFVACMVLCERPLLHSACHGSILNLQYPCCFALGTIEHIIKRGAAKQRRCSVEVHIIGDLLIQSWKLHESVF